MAAYERGNSITGTIARVILGVVFFIHGWQKLFTNGIDATTGFFTSVGVPFPEVAAWFSALAELIGGALLVVGLAVPLVALLLIINMLGAIYYVHFDSGFFAQGGGYELPLVLIAGLLAVAFGQGALAVDSYVRRDR